MLEAVEPPVGHAQHSRLQPRQQRLEDLPLAGPVWPQVGAQDRVRGALHQHHTLRLRVAGMAGAAAWVAEMRHVVSLVRQLEGAAVNGYQPQAGIERVGVRLSVGHGHTASLDQFTHRRRADLAAQAADRGLGHPRRLGSAGRPSQTLRHGGEHFLIRGLRVQAQSHAVVRPRYRRETAHPLRIAAVCIKDSIHHLCRHHPRKQAGAQKVCQPCSSPQHRLGSRHDHLRFCDGTHFASKFSIRTVLRPDPTFARPAHHW